jgi:hypothetical protein
MDRVEVSNAELRTVRHTARELKELVDMLEQGKADKFVLTGHGRMRAVLLSVESFARLTRDGAKASLKAA